MAFWSGVLGILLYVWFMLKEWFYIFISPMENLEMLWIIVPIWINWFFAEFFQEKKGTSFGNAISNGAVPLYIGIDWARHLTRNLTAGDMAFNFGVGLRYLLCLLLLAYGLSIIIFGIKAKKFIKVYGRIRETTYVMLMFSPVVYGIIDLTWRYMLIVVLFFPLYYYIIELIDKITPDPKIYHYDKGKDKEEPEPGADLGSDMGSDLGAGLDTGLDKSMDKDFKF